MQQSRKIGFVFLSLLGFCKQSNEKLRFSGPRSTLFFKKRETRCVKRRFLEPAAPKNDVLHSFYNDFRSFLGPLASPGLSRPLPASPGLSQPLPASPGFSQPLLAPRRLEEKRRRRLEEGLHYFLFSIFLFFIFPESFCWRVLARFGGLLVFRSGGGRRIGGDTAATRENR